MAVYEKTTWVYVAVGLLDVDGDKTRIGMVYGSDNACDDKAGAIATAVDRLAKDWPGYTVALVDASPMTITVEIP